MVPWKLSSNTASSGYLLGYTDTQGNGKYDNKKLSDERALVVEAYLKKALGKKAKVILIPAGEASSSPVASNKTRKGQALNRRSEILVKN